MKSSLPLNPEDVVVGLLSSAPQAGIGPDLPLSRAKRIHPLNARVQCLVLTQIVREIGRKSKLDRVIATFRGLICGSHLVSETDRGSAEGAMGEVPGRIQHSV